VKLPPGYKSLDLELDLCSDKQPLESARKNVNLDTVLWYIFTSGTTGLPKAAKVTNK
jgi:acyl-CoA synthetase (AMP-forming)/AMP-acid ligase II